MLLVMQEDIAIRQYDNLRRHVEPVLGRPPTMMSEPDLIAEAPCNQANVVVAGAESRWAKRRSPTLAELMGEPWVRAQPRKPGAVAAS